MTNKKQSFCEKVISKFGPRGPRGLQGPIGPQGPPGLSNSSTFYPIDNIIVGVDDSPSANIEDTVFADGDYIIQMQAFIECDIPGTIITTSLLKNSFLELFNVNYQQQHIVSGNRITYTHTAKITGVIAGESIGFNFASTAFTWLKNGSLVITKI